MTTSNGTITLLADTMSIGAAVNSGTARTVLESVTAGRGIDLGTNPSAGKLGLAQADPHTKVAHFFIAALASSAVLPPILAQVPLAT